MSTAQLDQYMEFIGSKCELSTEVGFHVELEEIHPWLKPHQRASVQWGVRGGRRAYFMSFGLGKTVIQLETLRLILERVGGRGLIVAPLGVRQEFKRDAETLGIPLRFIRRIEEADEAGIYITNYETVRDGKLDPAQFTVTTLDEAAVLRGFGGTKTFREFMRLFENVKYRFVATATPSPNEYIELLAYAAYLGIMDVGQAKTRFFKRDSTKADTLTLHPHKAKEFWMFCATFALFLDRPSDLNFPDDGYALPEMEVVCHEVNVEAFETTFTRDGQGKIYRDASLGVSEAAREKRETLDVRIAETQKILAAEPDEHFLLWHDLEDERRAIEGAVPGVVAVYGNQDLDEREKALIDFSEGRLQYMAGKPVMIGAGGNYQRFCARAIFVGIGFKFNDFIQAIHRLVRYLQTRRVVIHLIYSNSERGVYQILMEKWERHKEQMEQMRAIIREYGLSQSAIMGALRRSIGVERKEIRGENFTLVNNDSVGELAIQPENSVGLILTSIPFSSQYEYTPSYNDFGHSESNDQFFRQMDFLTPNLLRVLQPGRIAAIHVKDRIVPGGLTGLGFQTVYPFHMETAFHFMRHGFAFIGMKTIVTDVVRENNQTYRLGWTEQCKDGSKMGCGMPEYLLLFRKPPTDRTNSYADVPVVKEKPLCDADIFDEQVGFVRTEPQPFDPKTNWQRPVPGTGYSRGRWQFDAHGFSRSSGDRLLSSDELLNLPHDQIYKLWRNRSTHQVYDFEGHVAVAEDLDHMQRLPATFMLLPPHSWHPDVWADIARMRTLNMQQQQKGRQMHLCPLQEDICRRVITQFSMPGETVLDPFVGIGSVVYHALLLGRNGIGVELNPGYLSDAVIYCRAAEQKMAVPSLFDVLESEPVQEQPCNLQLSAASY